MPNFCNCFNKSDDNSKDRKTGDIDALLKKDVKQSRQEVKMLLLGAGESGKSTILKQMKLIHEGGYSVQEKRAFRAIVYTNVMTSMKTLLYAMGDLGISLENPEYAPHVDVIRSQSEQSSGEDFSQPVTVALTSLWSDGGVQACFRRAGKDFYLIDSAKYFLDSLDRITRPEYLPDDQDVLRCRVKTTGITETTFNIGDLTYRMFDVGGQRSERKKWIHCFENVTAIIFMVAISEYDQKLVEDDSVNRMQEALTLFDSICNSRWFSKTSIILFMNKIDIFKDKVEEIPIEKYFPDYEGGPDYDAGGQYFKNRFVELNMSDTKQIYVHFTCATDTNQIKFVMEAVNDIIIKESLRKAGLV